MRVYVFLSVAIFSVFVCTPFFSSAQEMTADQRAALQAQLAQIQTEIQQTQSKLADTQSQRTSYERDVAILDYKVQEAQLQIKQRDLTIKALKAGINQKNVGISELDVRVASDQESLAQILRTTQQMDDLSFIEIALGGSLTEIFKDIDNFEQIQDSMNQSFVAMATKRSDLSARKQALEDQQHEAQDLLRIQVLQQQSLKTTQKQKKDLVTAVKGQEATYQTMIKAKKQSAAQIEAALFNLRDSKAVSFGDMYSYAKEAGQKIGVRPALILAVLRQETNLGENVGQCLLTNSPNKGDGRGKNTGNLFKQVMKGSRDVDPFMRITLALGLDPTTQVVSCPQAGGYGGAMGPAQFIPSTWVLYEERLATVTGQRPANPWNPRTATFATALLMADNGADKQTPAAERLAALRYFAGWGNANKPAYAFYGNGVMGYAEEYQANIDIIEKR
jgi:peptidoglycan hydrolase CwlO-like protein